MNLDRLACGSCGASLHVPEGVQFVNCLHCGSSLQVRRNESVAFTEVVETLQEHASQLAQMQETLRQQTEVQEQLALQNELNRLDQEWDRESARWMWTDKHGGRHLPSKLSAVGIVLVTVIATGVASQVLPQIDPPNTLVLDRPQMSAGVFAICLVIVLIGGLLAVWNFWRALQYEQLQAEHLQNRARIVARLGPRSALKLPR